MRLTSILLLGLVTAIAHAADLKPGRASGTYTYDGRTVAIEFASTYVDHADDRTTLVLILSNKGISTDGWSDGADFMKYRMRNPFLGVAFWLDADRNIVRTAHFDAEGLPYGEETDLFEVKLQDDKAFLKGIAVSTDKAGKLGKPVVLDAEFSAAADPTTNPDSPRGRDE